MSPTHGKLLTSLMVTSLVCFLALDFAEARRGGGGGGGRGMSRGGPAASGSFQRSRVQPQRRSSNRNMNRDVSRQQRPANQDRQNNRQDNLDQRQDNRQDRFDQRQDNLDERQDNREKVYDDRKEYYDDRNEWYEDRWRAGAYLTVASWNRMGCRYNMVVVNGITYYDCDGTRYEQVYRGGQTVYIVVN
ncbi:MAG: hypothetical protein WBN65_13680 [Gammaproteobacteria bacterium]